MPDSKTGIVLAVLVGRDPHATFPTRGTLHQRGLVAVVERPGLIRVGDSVTVQS